MQTASDTFGPTEGEAAARAEKCRTPDNEDQEDDQVDGADEDQEDADDDDYEDGDEADDEAGDEDQEDDDEEEKEGDDEDQGGGWWKKLPLTALPPLESYEDNFHDYHDDPHDDDDHDDHDDDDDDHLPPSAGSTLLKHSRQTGSVSAPGPTAAALKC